MDSCNLPLVISAATCTIASQIDNTEELELLSAMFTQLGDTLNTIASQRALSNNDNENAE